MTHRRTRIAMRNLVAKPGYTDPVKVWGES
jgi:hypothetical protein